MRQGVELPRPGLLRRAHPAPARARGRGAAPGELGRRARARGRRPEPGARRVRGRIDPALLVHGHHGADPGRPDERPADERAGRQPARAHDLRHGRDRRHGDGPRPLARGRPGGVAARALRARLGLEPDVDRAAPVAQAARRAQGRRADRGGRPVPQPHRPRGRRAPAPAARHRRRARHRDDARDRRRRASRTRTGAAPTPTATTSCWPRWAPIRSSTGRRSAAIDAETIARVGREFASTRPSLLRLGVGAQRHLGAPAAYSHDRLAARAHRRLARPRRRLLVHPDRHGGGGQRRAAPARGPAPGPGAHDQHVPARPGAHRPRARPAGEGARVLELEPGRDRARPGARARGAAPRRPLRGGARAVHDRHRGPRRRGAAGHHPARAPRRAVLLGPPLPDLERAGDRAARRGQAEHRDLPAAGRAAGLRRPVLLGDRRAAASTLCSRASPRTGCASAAGPRSTSARDRPRTPTAASAPRAAGSRCARTTWRPRRWPTPRWPSASRWR